ncbi:MAG: LysE family translocator [Alphaproteobacteria bacterium]|nr:LysE family translocator [Alphaproteobacteria bacterium]
MLSFIFASILIELTPGPNMTWLAVLGATRGRAAALSAVGGVCLGLAFAGLVAGLGLTVLFDNFPSLITALRWAGTLYLFYLAYDAWSEASTIEKIETKSNRAYFTQGLISNVLNPKAYLFYAAILPQFLSITEQPQQEIALLTTVYVAIATLIHAAIALAAGSISNWLQHSPQAVLVQRAMAIAIALAAIWFFISTGNLK